MAQHFTLTIFPHGGFNDTTTASDPSLIKLLSSDGSVVQTQDVGGYNWDNVSTPGEVKKIPGHAKWNATGAATSGKWQEYFLLDDGTYRTMTGIYKGKFYTFSAAGAATNIDFSTPVTFQSSLPISMCQYGAYVLMAALGETPYKWMYGDAELSKLIQTGTEYQFKFIDQFYNHIIGAYSDQTNGMIDIRWTEALTPFASMTFPAANQLYKPDNDIGITGIKKMGNSRMLIYGRSSIHSFDYFKGQTTPFEINPVKTQLGTEAPWSIVDTGSSHCFLDPNQGFVELDAGFNWKPISLEIDTSVHTISRAYANRVVGKYKPLTREICWSVPLNGAEDNNTLLYYDLVGKRWRQEQRSATAFIFDDWGLYRSFTWTDLRTASPNTPSWPSSGTWQSYFNELSSNMFFGNSDGYTYIISGDSFDGADFSAWNNVPILYLPDPTKTKRIDSLTLELAGSGAFSVDFEWKSADSEKDIIAASYASIGSVSAVAGATNYLPVGQSGKYHQFRWGTDAKDEKFRVTKIILQGAIV